MNVAEKAQLKLVKQALPKMNNTQRDAFKVASLKSLREQAEKSAKKGMTLGQIIAPVYENRDFMEVLTAVGITKGDVKVIAENALSNHLPEVVEEKGDEEVPVIEQNYDKAAREILIKSAKLKLAQMNPLVGDNAKRRLFNEFINSLSQETFTVSGEHVIQHMLHFGKGQCQEYKTVKEHLAATIIKYPRLSQFKDVLEEKIRVQRLSHGVEN